MTQQGSQTPTSSPTDLAISGQGMFVTNSQPTSVNANSQVLFTRAGSFTSNKEGYLENSAGLYLMGWAANSQGTISTSNSLSSLTPINITALSSAVSPTSTASGTGNLNAAQAETQNAAVTSGTYSPTTAADSMTGYDAAAATPTGVVPDVTMQIPVSDSLGGQHILQVDFLNASTATSPNTWNVEIQSVPTSDVPGNGGVPGQVAYGTATFSSTGALTGLNLTDSSTGTALTSSATGDVSLNLNWNPALGLGSTAQPIDLNLGSLTQEAAASSLTGTANGTTFGSLSAVSVGADGTVTATFSNGTSRPIAQIAMATFPNEDGLGAVNGDAYQATTTSGAYNLTTAGSSGAGKIASSALEASTVDLSTEFTDLITTQSAYSAASKVISTADNMTQALLQIIQG